MSEDWGALLERLVEGDRLAFARFNRLVTGFLRQLRAYDFQDDWDDLRQEVIVALVQNARAGRLREPAALVGYTRIMTRNKFMDRLKRRLRHQEKETLPWEEETARALPATPDGEEAAALWSAVADLPGDERAIVEGIYRQGRTYQEMSDASGIPLGTLKRRLREALARLRRRMAPGPDPIGPVSQTTTRQDAS